MENILNVGDRIGLMNNDGDVEYGIILYIEPDPDLNLDWIYLRHEDDSKNDKYDHNPEIAWFWEMIENTSDRIFV